MMSTHAPFDERLDRLVNLDLGGRGVEHLHAANRERQGASPIGAAADALLAVEPGATIVWTTGSVSRAWISPTIGENDGPAGLAALVRAMSLSRRTLNVVLAEATLIEAIGKLMTAAGLTVVPLDKARIACADRSLLVVTLLPFTTDDAKARAEAAALLDDLKPALLFSTERVGRNADGIYCSMRGVDFGAERARIDHVFDVALERGLPTVAVGDGGNEIGMGSIAQAVAAHVKFGDARPAGGAGIGATSKARILVTAAVSNWGCAAIAAAMALRERNAALLHTPEMEGILLRRGAEIGLINSVDGIVDANVDGIAKGTHVAMAELLTAIVRPALR